MKKTRAFVSTAAAALLAAAIAAATLGACSCPNQGGVAGRGSITINFGPEGADPAGSAPGGRSARLSPEVIASLTHEITLDGPTGRIVVPVDGAGTARVSVSAGDWEISVVSTGPRPDNAPASLPGRIEWATGSSDGPVTVVAGQAASATIQMRAVNWVFTHEELLAAIAEAGAGEKTIMVGADITAAATYVIGAGQNVAIASHSGQAISRAPGHQGPIFENRGSLTLGRPGLSGVAIDGNGAAATGSAVLNAATGNLTMHAGASIANNSNASAMGGGVLNHGSFTMRGGAIENNTAAGGGGVAVVDGGSFTMDGGTIANNDAMTVGGGVVVAGGSTFTMSGGTIANNDTMSLGGGVAVVDGGSFTMDGGAISGNSAVGAGFVGGGGVVVAYDSAFAMHDGTIEDNNSIVGGGVVVMTGSAFAMSGGTIANNIAERAGGGVYVENTDSIFTMLDGAVRGNSAERGGGVYISFFGEFHARGGTISGNSATLQGGGAHNAGTFRIENIVIHGSNAAAALGNTAPTGAALSIEPGYYALLGTLTYDGVFFPTPGPVAEVEIGTTETTITVSGGARQP